MLSNRFLAIVALPFLVAGSDAGAEFATAIEVPRGIVSSEARAVLGSDLVARIARLPFSDGDRFSAGDTLIEFDCRRYLAELEAAEAEEKVARLSVDENEELRKHRAVGLKELEISQAKHLKAQAGARALAVRVTQCKILAPYDGRVVERVANEHEIPRANEPILKIVDDRRLEIDLIIPSTWLAWLKPGATFDFLIDETQQRHAAQIRKIGATVDPVSQTIRVKGSFLSAPTDVLPGMSGSAYFEEHLRRARNEREG